jgi:dipeptidyl aminopeptidase/acylaminoacyl peptidase
MSTRTAFTIDDLWALDRVGAPSLSPNGHQAVASVTTASMHDNHSRSRLWLLSTEGAAPRALTHCGDRDGQPAWSPGGDLIAFLARREQQGEKDAAAQLYLIAPDGGEARRAASLATGVEAFKWFPDGRRIAFISWVWPELRGAQAQARRLQAWQARKETGVVTEETLYRYWDRTLPPGRVPHLHVLDVGTGRVRDLFEGTPLELNRAEPTAHGFDIAPDGSRIVFAFDPAPVKHLDGRSALVEIDVATGKWHTRVHDIDWDVKAPCYSPDGDRIAFVASHQGRKHTLPGQLAVAERLTADGRPADGPGLLAWQVVSAAWDHDVTPPLRWEADGQAVLLLAEDRGTRPLWRFDLPDARAERVTTHGVVNGFDKQAGVTVVNLDSLTQPPHLLALVPGAAPRRIDRFNDRLLARRAMGRHDTLDLPGALGDPVQVRLVYPPDFDPARRWPVLHLLHGGPHSAFGDNWHWRWNHQVLAAAGYVVACVNYHGSSGFGHAFLDAITHRWGELELQDIEATSDWLLAQPWADRDRLYAAGGSYGGYLTAWMNGRVPAGRYAAYVCHAGCFDWVAMFADDAYVWHAKELGAHYWDDPARVAAQSPHSFAAQMSTPTLVTHGAQDFRVPDAQGLAYYNTLKARGVKARLLWFPDENHWIVKPRNNRLWYCEVLAWLGSNRLSDLPSAPPP